VGGPCRSPCPAGYRSRQFRWESREFAYITAYGRSSLVATLVDVFPTTVYCSGAAVGSQQVSYTCLTCPSGCHSPGVALTNREPGGLFWNPEMNPTAFYVAVDLEIPTQVQAVLWAGLGAIDNAPPSLVLSQSADAVTWTQVASVDLTPYVGSSSQTVVALPTPYAAAARYWKMEIVAPVSGFQPIVRTLGLCDTSDCAEMPTNKCGFPRTSAVDVQRTLHKNACWVRMHVHICLACIHTHVHVQMSACFVHGMGVVSRMQGIRACGRRSCVVCSDACYQ